MRNPTTAVPASFAYAAPPQPVASDRTPAELTTIAHLVDRIRDLADEVLVGLEAREAEQVRWAELETAFLVGYSQEEIAALLKRISKANGDGNRAPRSFTH